MSLNPQADITDADLERARRCLVGDSGWASVCGALFGGVVLAAWAVQAGAGPLAIGLLAAIPYITQVLQLPATVLVDRMGQRKRLAVWLLGGARLVILALALVPLWPRGPATVPLLLLGKAAICAFSAVAACALNSWMHQLLGGRPLGAFFSNRLMVGTLLGCVFTLAAGWLVEHPPRGDANLAYSLAFAGSALAGFASVAYLARCPEPVQQRAGPQVPLGAKLAAPFRDRGFRPLLVMLGAWNFTSNFAAPFLTLYLMQQLGYGIVTVTGLWVVNQVFNAMTMVAWGRVSDRLSNKAILSVALPVFFACTVGLALTRLGAPLGLQLALLVGVHAVMGAVGGGIGLATGNLGIKLAPAGQATTYLAAVGLVSSAAGGLAPLVAGGVGEWLQSSQLSLVLRWNGHAATRELSVLRFEHYEFLFAIAGLLGLYVMHALSRVVEGEEVSERRVVQQLLWEARQSVDQLSSLGSSLGGVFAFERLNERRVWFRRRAAAPGPAATPLD